MSDEFDNTKHLSLCLRAGREDAVSHLARVLTRCQGNVTAVAHTLGVSRATVHNWLSLPHCAHVRERVRGRQGEAENRKLRRELADAKAVTLRRQYLELYEFAAQCQARLWPSRFTRQNLRVKDLEKFRLPARPGEEEE